VLNLSSKLVEEMLCTDNNEYHCRDCDDTYTIACPLLLCFTCKLVYFNYMAFLTLRFVLCANCSLSAE